MGKNIEWALALVERVSKRTFDTLSDAALIRRLGDSARALFVEGSDSPTEETLIDALAVVGEAVRRRMGVWRAVLDDPADLSGPVREVRLLADKLLDPTDPNAPIHSVNRHTRR